MAVRTYSLRGSRPAPTLRIDYARLLNPEQLAAVEAPPGPVLVIAGAGTGKTRTLTFRVARLLEAGLPPESLLLLTFTNKAAREMTRRVEELAGGLYDVRRILGGTFHHAAFRLLREHGQVLGFAPDFGILDREDARDLMALCIGSRGKVTTERRFPRADVLLDLVSMTINLQRPMLEVLADRWPQFLPLADELLAVAVAFQQRKLRQNVMDFDDLLLHLKRLLVEHPVVRERIAGRFRAVLVDEYQDTNHLQGELVDYLAGPEGRVTAVGDDCQSIYGFRGADFRNILDFPERHPGCQVFRLTRNYRSTPEVLALANTSIAHNTRQFAKELRAERPSGPRPVLVPARDGDEQAAFVAQRVLELRDEGVPLAEQAVLYRAHAHSLELQLELARRGIPYRVRSGVRFLEQAHIKDVLAHLRAVQNPRDAIAFVRAARLYPGIGQAIAATLQGAVAEEGAPGDLAAALERPGVTGAVPPRARAGFQRLKTVLVRLCAPGAAGAPGQMIRDVLEGGYAEHLQDTFVASDRRADDLRQLAEYAGRFPTLGDFLSEVALLSELSGEDAAEGEGPDEWLTLSTVHQAKGLEWRAVFVLGLAEGRFPLMMAVRTQEEEEEERRLFYVAVTRARDELALVYPLMSAPRDGERVLLRASRFLQELPEGDRAPYDRLLLQEEADPAWSATPSAGGMISARRGTT
ncbi:MAG: ATP-dependent helicase [Myxococcaceae bacterium]|nr:ATP-dependent helicase [Myxococcaceae bacterium]